MALTSDGWLAQFWGPSEQVGPWLARFDRQGFGSVAGVAYLRGEGGREPSPTNAAAHAEQLAAIEALAPAAWHTADRQRFLEQLQGVGSTIELLHSRVARDAMRRLLQGLPVERFELASVRLRVVRSATATRPQYAHGLVLRWPDALLVVSPSQEALAIDVQALAPEVAEPVAGSDP